MGSPPPEFFRNDTLDPPVRGFLHVPEKTIGEGIILTHGAGSNAQAPLLVVVAEAFAAAGFHVLRCNLPYRQVRPGGPPGPGDAARDRAGLKNAVATIRELAPGRVFLGGHSYGGRQSSMLAASQTGLVSGLLLLSYPLHPPRKPDQLRTQHFPDLQTRSLFVQGTRDPFGSIEEMKRALASIPAETRLLPVEGAGHDLNFKKGSATETLPQTILSAFQEFFR